MTPRLPDIAKGLTTAGYDNASEISRGVVGQRNRPERRHREAACQQGAAALEFVAAGQGGAARIAGEPECFVYSRGNRHGTIAHRDHAVRRMLAEAIDDSLDRSELVMKTDRNRLVPPRIVELIAAVARKDETHAEFFGRLAERANLIAGRRRNDETTRRQTSRRSSTMAPRIRLPQQQSRRTLRAAHIGATSLERSLSTSRPRDRITDRLQRIHSRVAVAPRPRQRCGIELGR